MEFVYCLWSSDPDQTIDATLISICADKASEDHAFWQNGEDSFIEKRKLAGLKSNCTVCGKEISYQKFIGNRVCNKHQHLAI